jgi:hypothetical protein
VFLRPRAARARLPVAPQQLHARLRPRPPDLAERDCAAVQVAVQDLTAADDRPPVHPDRPPLGAQILDLRIAQALWTSNAFRVGLPRDAREPAPSATMRKIRRTISAGSSATEVRGVLRARQPLVLVAVDAAADHMAALEPSLRGVADARRGLRRARHLSSYPRSLLVSSLSVIRRPSRVLQIPTPRLRPRARPVRDLVTAGSMRVSPLPSIELARATA